MNTQYMCVSISIYINIYACINDIITFICSNNAGITRFIVSYRPLQNIEIYGILSVLMTVFMV